MSKKDKQEKKDNDVQRDKELKGGNIQNIVSTIQKSYGTESIRKGIISGPTTECQVISSRCLSLDIAMGVGGFPKGRIIEIFGPESSGKTTLAMTAIVEAQSKGGVAAFIDAEHAFDPTYAKQMGMNLDDLLFSQPDSGEQALGIAEDLVKCGKVDIVVVDSVAALVPQAEIDGELGESHIGLQARMMSQVMRRIKGEVRKSGTCLIFINQIREKIGMMMPGQSNEVTPGGRALKFYASVRLDIRRIGHIASSDKDKKIGNETKVKVVKNKVAPPFKEALFQIVFGRGISYYGSILDTGVRCDIIERAGSNYSYGNTKLGVGFKLSADFLENNKNIANEIKDKIWDKIKKENFVTPVSLEEDTEDIDTEGEDTDAGEQDDNKT